MSTNEETNEERSARYLIENRALHFGAEGSLRSRLERVLAAGGYYASDDGCTIEKSLMQYAGIMTKAIAIAVMAEGVELDGPTNIASSSDSGNLLSVEEAARGLLGLSALMTEGYHLLHQIEMADGSKP